MTITQTSHKEVTAKSSIINPNIHHLLCYILHVKDLQTPSCLHAGFIPVEVSMDTGEQHFHVCWAAGGSHRAVCQEHLYLSNVREKVGGEDF